jgi:hypothetical protein
MTAGELARLFLGAAQRKRDAARAFPFLFPAFARFRVDI